MMDKYFLYNPLTRMYYSGQGYNSFDWAIAPSKVKIVSKEDGIKIANRHFEKWDEQIWIVLSESMKSKK